LIGFADPLFRCKSQEPKVLIHLGGILGFDIANARVVSGSNFEAALAPLPDTAEEVRRVAASVKAPADDLFLGAMATERNIKTLKLDDYRIVYFATHGLVADEVAKRAKLKPEPALVLSLPDNPDEIDDGVLTASEVAQLKLDADWEVLSACNTAAGERPGAEALSRLASAFFYAGGRSLLASHWEVETESASHLMAETFAALENDRGLSHGQALQHAMLAMIDDTHIPNRPILDIGLLSSLQVSRMRKRRLAFSAFCDPM
jgi:CHAT domain-containing protein